MSGRTTLTIVLAAGEGTRMRSSLPKVLHPVAGKPLIAHVLAAAPGGEGNMVAVVVGPDHQAVVDEVTHVRPGTKTYVQRERLGTAHAVLAAREVIEAGADDLLVAFGDTPLIDATTFERMREALKDGAALAVLDSAPPIRRAMDGFSKIRVSLSRSANMPMPAKPSGP